MSGVNSPPGTEALAKTYAPVRIKVSARTKAWSGTNSQGGNQDTGKLVEVGSLPGTKTPARTEALPGTEV